MRTALVLFRNALTAPHIPQREGRILGAFVDWLASLFYPGKQRRIPSLKPGTAMRWQWRMRPYAIDALPMPDGYALGAVVSTPMRCIVTAKGKAWEQVPLRRPRHDMPIIWN